MQPDDDAGRQPCHDAVADGRRGHVGPPVRGVDAVQEGRVAQLAEQPLHRRVRSAERWADPLERQRRAGLGQDRLGTQYLRAVGGRGQAVHVHVPDGVVELDVPLGHLEARHHDHGEK